MTHDIYSLSKQFRLFASKGKYMTNSYDDCENSPIAADGILKDPFNDRGVSQIGSMVMLTLLNGNSFLVHAEDIKGIEENIPARCLKLFIAGKTSPVMVSSSAFDLAQVLSSIRDRQN